MATQSRSINPDGLPEVTYVFIMNQIYFVLANLCQPLPACKQQESTGVLWLVWVRDVKSYTPACCDDCQGHEVSFKLANHCSAKSDTDRFQLLSVKTRKLRQVQISLNVIHSHLKISSVEELETVSAGTKPRTSHHRSPGGERRRHYLRA